MKGESPDFRLSRAGMTTGLEIRKATAEEFEADLTRFAPGRETKHYESDLDEGGDESQLRRLGLAMKPNEKWSNISSLALQPSWKSWAHIPSDAFPKPPAIRA
jgi:hypothetical protein